MVWLPSSLLLLLLLHVGSGDTAKCPDGSDGLTKELYEAGNVEAYTNITCIPANGFEDYTGSVSLNGLGKLKSIEDRAFKNFKGALTIGGGYPALEYIGYRAFSDEAEAGTSASVIVFEEGLAELKTIGDYALYNFKGRLTIGGSYPLLESIGVQAFRYAGTDQSTVAIACSSLTEQTIDPDAFANFYGKRDATKEQKVCCNGKGDLLVCAKDYTYPDDCEDPIIGDKVSGACPILCQSCTQRRTTGGLPVETPVETPDEKTSGSGIAAAGVLIPLLLIGILVGVWWIHFKGTANKEYNFEQQLDSVHAEQLAVRAEVRADELRAQIEGQDDTGNCRPPPLPPLPPPRITEIKREDVLKVGVLGSGNFGEVWECTLNGTTVAAKIVRINEKKVAHLSDIEKKAKLYKENISLGNEAIVMMALGTHSNVVELLGVVRKKGPLMVVLQAEDGGDLKKVLAKMAAERLQQGTPVDFAEKNKWVREIADGMKHIAGKHVVHRDLAARNIMVSSSGSCKIADFGLARVMKTKRKERDADDDEIYESYYRAHSSYFPVRWTAPEGVKENRFSSSSDVWSFAIVIVEIWQDGRKPYRDKNNRAVRSALEVDPNFMHPNVGCKDNLYSLMQDCWNQAPARRPSFAQIVQRLKDAEGDLKGDSTVGADLLDDDGYAKPTVTIAKESSGGGGGVRQPRVQTATTTYVESPVYEFGSQDADALMVNVTI